MTFLTFLRLQLERLSAGTAHAPGPKKPNLTQTDNGLDPRKLK